VNERLEHARRLGQRIDAGWQHEDVEAQLARLHVRQHRRARRRELAAPLGALALAVAIFTAVSVLHVAAPRPAAPEVTELSDMGPPPQAPPPTVATPPRAAELPAPPSEVLAPPSGVLALGDGSVVTPLAPSSRLLARQVSETDVVVALRSGGARFDVPDRETRRFRAELGAVALETRGAAFRVGITRRQIEVAAERGEVSAHWGRERHVVAAGQTRTFSIAERADAAAVEPEEPLAAPEPSSTWRDDAARGDYAAAWRALSHASAPLEAMADLLLAGDVARLSGHPEAAVAPLSRAVALHVEDPRAQLAAFTLGRVHLEDLGAPRDAAAAFARARELAPAGPLAEDALAREVEAWSRAGETEAARRQALSYTRRYPRGHRVHAVRRFGGLEGP
jgi:transmembrane sensor